MAAADGEEALARERSRDAALPDGRGLQTSQSRAGWPLGVVVVVPAPSSLPVFSLQARPRRVTEANWPSYAFAWRAASLTQARRRRLRLSSSPW